MEEEALQALEKTLDLLPPNAQNDLEVVKKEISQLKGETSEESKEAPKETEKLRSPEEASPSAKNVPAPVEVESPPATGSSRPSR